MQENRRTNQQRTQDTRQSLLAAARALFVEKGYAETSTPEIVAAAGITRGALYHHFENKRDLFRAVLAAEAREVAETIERSSPVDLSPLEALLEGCTTYLDAMQVRGRTRLLLIEGPTVLGSAYMAGLDNENAARTLRQGLAAVNSNADMPTANLDALADLLSAAFDRAALAADGGAPTLPYRVAITNLIKKLSAQ